VFFISLVGVDEKGFVDDHEHIYDIYTKLFDFWGRKATLKGFHGNTVSHCMHCARNLNVISAQDLRDFYTFKQNRYDRKKD